MKSQTFHDLFEAFHDLFEAFHLRCRKISTNM
jgi:hypothetical protein